MNPVMQSIQDILEENASLKRRVAFMEEGLDGYRAAKESANKRIEELEEENKKLKDMERDFRRANDELADKYKSLLIKNDNNADILEKENAELKVKLARRHSEIIDFQNAREITREFTGELVKLLERFGYKFIKP